MTLLMSKSIFAFKTVLSSSSSQFLSLSSPPTYSQSSKSLFEFNVLISTVIILVIMENFVFPISVTAAVSNKLRGRRQSPQNNQPRNSVLLLCTLSICVHLCTFIKSKCTIHGNDRLSSNRCKVISNPSRCEYI